MPWRGCDGTGTGVHSKGPEMGSLSDTLSFSAHRGSTRSSQHPDDVPFFLLSFSVSCAFSFQSYRVSVFFSPSPYSPFSIAHFSSKHQSKSLSEMQKKEFSLLISREVITLQDRNSLGLHPFSVMNMSSEPCVFPRGLRVCVYMN